MSPTPNAASGAAKVLGFSVFVAGQAGAMQWRRDLTGLSSVDATPYVPWVRDVQPGYAKLIAYRSSHHRLQSAAMLGCQYAHQGAGLWPHDVSDAEALKYFLGISSLPKPKK